jgi:hypothetical protein
MPGRKLTIHGKISTMRPVKYSTLLIFLGCSFVAGAQQVDSTATDSLKRATKAEIPSKTKEGNRQIIKRISLGGSTGFWINLRNTHVEIAPMIAYHFPKIVTIGAGYRYIYNRDRILGKNLNSYGPNLFARAQLTKRLYLWTEWESLRTEYAIQALNQEVEIRQTTANSYFAGIGYLRSVRKNGRGKISIQVLYNFLYDREDRSPYYSPVIYRVGYFF